MEEGYIKGISVGISMSTLGTVALGGLVVGGLGYGLYKGKIWLEETIKESVKESVRNSIERGSIERENSVKEEILEEVRRITREKGKEKISLLEKKEIIKELEELKRGVERNTERGIEIVRENQERGESVGIIEKQLEENCSLLEKIMESMKKTSELLMRKIRSVEGTQAGDEEIVVKLQDMVERLIGKLIEYSADVEKAEALRELLIDLVERIG